MISCFVKVCFICFHCQECKGMSSAQNLESTFKLDNSSCVGDWKSQICEENKPIKTLYWHKREANTHAYKLTHKYHRHYRGWQGITLSWEIHTYVHTNAGTHTRRRARAHTHAGARAHTHTHTHTHTPHSQVCMSDCVPSEAAPAGSMESLINTPFHMSNFMALKFLSSTSRVCVCVCVLVSPSFPSCLKVKPYHILPSRLQPNSVFVIKKAVLKAEEVGRTKRSKQITCTDGL